MKKIIDDLTIWVLLIGLVALAFIFSGCAAEGTRNTAGKDYPADAEFLTEAEAVDAADQFLRGNFAREVIRFDDRPEHFVLRVDSLQVLVTGFYQELRPDFVWADRRYLILVRLDSTSGLYWFPEYEIEGRPMPPGGGSGVVKPWKN